MHAHPGGRRPFARQWPARNGSEEQPALDLKFAGSRSRMAPTAVVFPGQGSQRPGMARDFHDRFAVSREVFTEASDALGLDLSAICFGNDPRLDLTEFTQPAILVAEM